MAKAKDLGIWKFRLKNSGQEKKLKSFQKIRHMEDSQLLALTLVEKKNQNQQRHNYSAKIHPYVNLKETLATQE